MLNALLLPLSTMVSRAIPLAVTLALAVLATAQNLVPNPSFEDTALCNTYDPVRLQAARWFNVNWATPDVYECDLVRRCGVVWDPADPGVQASGYQYARTGTRFAGAFHWDGPGGTDLKEYLMVKLDQDLIGGNSYAVSLYYSRADGFEYALDRISVYFSVDSIHEDDFRTLHVQPQVDLMDPEHEYLTNATDWVQLTGAFVATGGEHYVVIGSFLDSSQINTTVAPTGSAHYAYYYYDDVSVVANDQSGIGEIEFTAAHNRDGTLSLSGLPDGAYAVRVLDYAGRVIVEDPMLLSLAGQAAVTIGDQGLAQGLYLVSVWSKERMGSARFTWTGGRR